MSESNLLDIDLGNYLRELRQSRGLSLKDVSDQLGIDFSMLSKIENGERQIQAHMIKPLSELFKIDYKELQIHFLNQKIADEFGDEPYFEDSLVKILKLKNVI